MKQTFDVTGMTCAACSAHVDKAARKVEGVTDVSVNLLKNSMEVEYAQGLSASDISAINDSIAQEVAKGGYGASPRQDKPAGSVQGSVSSAKVAHERQMKAARDSEQHMRMRLVVSVVFCVPLFYIAMGGMFGWPMPQVFSGEGHMLVSAITQMLLVTPIVFVDFKFFSGGFKSLFHLSPNMDALIAIGATASLVYSIYQVYAMALSAAEPANMAGAVHAGLYFDSAGMILTLITLGKYFEARAKGKTTDALSSLIDLAPKTATVVRDGTETEIAVEQVLVGDTLVVRTGQAIPLDGKVLEGSCSVDESAITGESIPADKAAGDAVTGATILKSGYITMEVTKTGDDTVLAGIINLVDQATSSKAPIQNTADKIAGVFVPAVIGIAALTFVVWMLIGAGVEQSLTYAVSVLVISCPCALGLAAPTAVMVGTGRGAAHGILIKSAESLELAGRAQTVVFDKTGTITQGKPAVVGVTPCEGVSERDLLAYAASIESMSEHPLAQAILEYSASEGIPALDAPLEGFEQIAGQGLKARMNGETLLAGNAKMMIENGISLDGLDASVAEYSGSGATPLYFALGGSALGVIALSDSIKPSSPQAVSELKALEIGTVMLTGDNANTAAAIQRLAGVDRVLAGLLPGDKEREVFALQRSGGGVVMVGDGVNDAPALARADVGVAIGNGTDIAIESADMVLMRSDLLDVVAAVQLSRRTLLTIKQNLFWALIYNVICIPVAAGVFAFAGLSINPMIGAAAMGCSSIFVVGNALRLRTWKPRFAKAPPAEAHDGSATMQGGDSGQPVPDESALDGGSMAASHADGAEVIRDQGNGFVEKGLTMEKTLKVDGMMCGKCEEHVRKALEALDGVEKAVADHEAGTAVVTLSGYVSDDSMVAAVKDAGYEASIA